RWGSPPRLTFCTGVKRRKRPCYLGEPACSTRAWSSPDRRRSSRKRALFWFTTGVTISLCIAQEWLSSIGRIREKLFPEPTSPSSLPRRNGKRKAKCQMSYLSREWCSGESAFSFTMEELTSTWAWRKLSRQRVKGPVRGLSKGWFMVLLSRYIAFGLLIELFCVATADAQTGSAQPDTQPAAASAQNSAPAFAEPRRLMEQGRFDDAIAELQRLAASSPPPKGFSHELGVAYYKKGDYVKAIESLKKATAENPADNESTQLLGLSFYLSGRPGDAIPLLEKVQTWFPRANVDAAYILGNCYIQTKDYPNARKAFARMFDVSPDSAASYLFTARMLLRQEFDPVAEEYAQKAAALDPKLPLAHLLLGELFLYKSRVPEAIAEFQKELAINPGHAQAYYKLADAYARIQKFDDAERLLQRSIWLDATSTGPFIVMGKVLQKKGETELAIRALQRAATMDPNNSITHHLLGQAYRDLGKTEDAERELKVAGQLQDAQNAKQ